MSPRALTRAPVALGGERLATGAAGSAPTVFAGVTPDMSIAREEIFGPVLSMLTFDTLDEAIRIANSTASACRPESGPADIDTSQTPRAISAPDLWVNRWMDGYPELPFGGFGEAGWAASWAGTPCWTIRR